MNTLLSVFGIISVFSFHTNNLNLSLSATTCGSNNKIKKHEVQTIADDTLERLKVHFHEDELRCTLECLDVRRWQEALEQDAKAVTMNLLLKARQLCKALQVEFDIDVFHCLIFEAIRQRTKLLIERDDEQKLQGMEPDSRLVWHRAAAASRGAESESAFEKMSLLLSFLFSLEMGTGSVERDLGALKAFEEPHKGGKNSEHDRSHWAAVCLDLWSDGPQTEADVVGDALVENGILLLTDFTRRCADLWVSVHGRRFGIYKERCDKDTKRCVGKRSTGTLKAVKLAQEAATVALSAMAEGDKTAANAPARQTLLGFPRGDIAYNAAVAKRTGEVATTKRMAAFRAETALVLQTKKSVACYPGFAAKAKMRRKTICGESRATSEFYTPLGTCVASRIAAQAAKWLGKKGAALLPAAASAKKKKKGISFVYDSRSATSSSATWPRRQPANVVVPSVCGLVRQNEEMSNRVLLRWVNTLCRGGTLADAAGHVLHCEPAAVSSDKLVVSQRFKTRCTCI